MPNQRWKKAKCNKALRYLNKSHIFLWPDFWYLNILNVTTLLRLSTGISQFYLLGQGIRMLNQKRALNIVSNTGQKV